MLLRIENTRSGGMELGEFASTAQSTNLKAGTFDRLEYREKANVVRHAAEAGDLSLDEVSQHKRRRP